MVGEASATTAAGDGAKALISLFRRRGLYDRHMFLKTPLDENDSVEYLDIRGVARPKL